MIGGYQILDLRGIDLSKGAVASNITDAYVLKQLLQLRDHIDKAYDFSKPLTNQLKPVLIRFRDKKSGEKTEGATFGELSVNGNYYTFKITARISGALVLTINVAFEEVTNDYGNKEWVIDSATILLKDESKTITGDLELSGDLSVGDDASIGGDLSVVGDINGKDIDMSGKIEGAEIVEKMVGYAFYANQLDHAWSPVYVGICKNGNKLTFVIFGTFTTAQDETTVFADLGNLVVPKSVFDKLYPYTIGGNNAILATSVVKAVDASATPYASKGIDVIANIIKYESGDSRFIIPRIYSTELTAEKTYYFRIEQTFLLSDNLISNE